MIPKVSVIVPIYNSEKYLRECIDSILNQSLKEIEIILINDGSTDNSHNICEEYKKKYSKIVYINNKNKGCSATRNLGIKLSKGKYIGFVDSDDYIEKEMYKEMYEEAERKSLDLVIGGIRYTKNNKIMKSKLPTDNIKDCNILDEKNLIMLVVNKIFKKSIMEINNIYFPENSHFQEDGMFSFIYSLNVKKVGIIKKIFYNYRLHSSNSVYNIKKRLDIFVSYKILYKYIKENKKWKKELKYFYKLYNLYAIGGTFLLLSDKKNVSKEEYKKYKNIFTKRLLREIKIPLSSKFNLIFFYFLSTILRITNLKEFLLKIRRKLRKEI